MQSIAIIGMGPRGSSLLERLISHLIARKAERRVHFCLFEKRHEPGPGCHQRSLPPDLLMNTVAAQVTMYFGRELEQHGPVHGGRNLHEWYQHKLERHTKETEYLPRRKLGEYLRDFHLEQIERMKRNGISHEMVSREVIDIIPGNKEILITTDKRVYRTNHAVICTGHESARIDLGEGQESDYSEEKLHEINPGQVVAVKGMGLTAFDIISRLSKGRGGTYKRGVNGKLRYEASGGEPRVHLFSRNGIFHAGRARNDDPRHVYAPTYFTKEVVESLREKHGRLDFDKDLLPLLKQELQHICTQRGESGSVDLDLLLHPERHLNRNSRSEFCSSFLAHLEWDLGQCTLGKMNSTYKYCQDAIRDLRDQFRAAIEFNGLHADSYLRYQSYWNPRFLKICVGPPYQRLEELQALIEGGVCSIEFAANPQIRREGEGWILTCRYGRDIYQTYADHLINASVASMNISESVSALARNISKRFKTHQIGGQNCGGLEISSSFEVINSSGVVQENIYALGIPTEGSKYFTLVLGRPNIESTFLLDSNRLATQIVNRVSA